MAQRSKYKVAFRRRAGKTNFAARMKLVDLDKSRLVVRVSNLNIIAQIINVGENGDETIVSAHSNELQKMGWLGGTNNTSVAYLTTYLCGKKALNNGITKAILDIGLKPSVKGSKIFAAVKGANDAGLNVPYGETIVPEENRINGEHIAEYAKYLDKREAKKRFSKYIKRGLQPVDLPNHFEEIKNKIENV